MYNNYYVAVAKASGTKARNENYRDKNAQDMRTITFWCANDN